MTAQFRSTNQPCVIFVANRGFALTSSRLLLIKHFLSCGWQVVAATAMDDHTKQMAEIGVIIEPVCFNRGGLSPFADWQAFVRLRQIYHKYRPHLIHHFHVKPIILGTFADQRLQSATKIVNNIEGLGYAFVRGGIPRFLAGIGYQLSLRKSAATIFLNPDDRDLFLEKGWISESKARLIISPGVDLESFYPATNFHDQPLRVLLAARLLWQKGIKEFVEAAQIVKKTYPGVCFQLAGELDLDHPDAVNEEWINTSVQKGFIEFLGYIKNIESLFRTVDIFVLPSYYREGVPRVLLEAGACGLPVITTDVPGCKEAVVDGETGYLIPPQNSQALAAAISAILSDSQLRHRMGQASRRRVEVEFDIRLITEKYLELYREIGIEVTK